MKRIDFYWDGEKYKRWFKGDRITFLIQVDIDSDFAIKLGLK